MRYFCLTCDYDGTIAHDSVVAPSTVKALKRVSASGRKLVLATGRELKELLEIFPDVSMFDRVIAENGAVLYRPASRDQKLLAEAPPPQFADELRRRGVSPVFVGQCIVATWHPHESTVLEVIRTLGFELHVIFNKDAVMVLPSGVNKGTGLNAALDELGLSPHNVVGVGDAENDHGFLGMCECAVAVDNALPALKDRADYVTRGDHGMGVEELIEQLLSEDLASLSPRLKRHRIFLGHTENGEDFFLEPYGSKLLVAGPSGAGKSTTVTAIVERLVQCQYQVCLIDPEGDYDDYDPFVTLGGPDRIPGTSEVLEVLNTKHHSMSVNLLGVPMGDRPRYFLELLSQIQQLRARTGRPHWIIVDEAHHLLPATLDSASLAIPKELSSLVLVTVEPDHVSHSVLSSVNGLIAIGPEPARVIAQFNSGAGKNLRLRSSPAGPAARSGHALIWLFSESQEPLRVTIEPAKVELRRHKRKYAAGDLGADKSFYFRGPDGRLKLRAQNMNVFAQLAEGVDDETWTHHLRNADYSRWLRESVKDQDIADEVARIEQDEQLEPSESRAQIIETLRKHYTASA
jgi:HAD superfamily hydrolase (TIGR01484 family)